MRKFALILAIGLLLATSSVAMATKPDDYGQHKVWVCKYVGQPGAFETLKPGKNPIIVDVAAADDFVGADFADGQTHSLVIDLATEANTGQGERYIGEAQCPTPEETSFPTSNPTEGPVITPSPTATPEVTSSPTNTPEPTVVVEPTAEVTASPTGTAPELTLPPTDAASNTETATVNVWPIAIFLIAIVTLVLMVLKPKRR